jgi:hypothetical protein
MNTPPFAAAHEEAAPRHVREQSLGLIRAEIVRRHDLGAGDAAVGCGVRHDRLLHGVEVVPNAASVRLG